ncbi:MAG: EFR1 family ferrodoxin [Bacillota bacterium]|nr:EFR1 family ferrodoxin [Bacillota bacterium]
MKILILYNSGAGSTKTIAEIYHEKLSSYNIDITPLQLNFNYKRLEDYNFIIFAFPTYHCDPSRSMLEFIEKMPVFKDRKRAFVFTTYGLFPGNALTRFIKECSSRNIITCGYTQYKSPATDGALLLPPLGFMFHYEKNIVHKLRKDINNVKEIIETDVDKIKYPRFKLYTILNYPNKLGGKAMKHKLKIIKENCVKCYKCVDNCIRHCWTNNGEYPQFDVYNCEFCFRCIHHCPKKAIIISDKTKNKPRLSEQFYDELKKSIIDQL